MNTVTATDSIKPEFSTNPWLSIWTKPRSTIREIVDIAPEHCVYLIACAWGVGAALDNAATKGGGQDFGMLAILAIGVVLGVIGGLLTLYLHSFLIRWTGQWIGGTDDSTKLRAAVAWSGVPMAASLLLWIPILLVDGHSAFMPGALSGWLQLAQGFIGFFLLVWSIVLLVNCVAEVQGFSIWKGLANLLLALGVVILPLIAVAIVVVIAVNV